MTDPFFMKAVVSIFVISLGVLLLWANQTGEKNKERDDDKA